MENKNNENAYTDNGLSRDEPTYGAVYSPLEGREGEYSYQAYSSDHTPDEAQAKPAAKKRGTGAVIGIIAAVTVSVCIILLLTAGVLYFAKGLFNFAFGGEGTDSDGSGTPALTTADKTTAPLPDHSGDKIYVSEGTENTGLNVVTVTPGQEMSVVDAVAAVKDTVVEIRTESVVKGTGRYSQYIVSGAGSGVIISEGGLIITNNHVIEGATKITVSFTDGTSAEATLIGTDDEADIAVISVDPAGRKLATAVIGNSDTLRLGETVIAIGNPLGELGGSVSMGIISSAAREISIDSATKMTLIQTDAAINPGNSGGALFNLRGELIGIVNAKSSGDSIEGLGFAIPVNTAWSVADNLIKYGYVPGRMIMSLKGVSLEDNYGDYVLSYGNCIVVTAADDDSPFKVGDIITDVGGVSVSSVSELQKALRAYSSGDSVQIKVTRRYNEGFFTYSRSGYVSATVVGTESGNP